MKLIHENVFLGYNNKYNYYASLSFFLYKKYDSSFAFTCRQRLGNLALAMKKSEDLHNVS
jgi:hypothetical protein